MDDCNKEPLVGDGVKSSFDMMQHLINEMDKSSQRIDEFNTDEVWTGTDTTATLIHM